MPRRQMFIDCDGFVIHDEEFGIYRDSRNHDAEGNRIERSKREYPYNFSDYVRWVNSKYRGRTNPCTIVLEEGKRLDTSYTDHLASWNREHFDACFAKSLPIGSGGFRSGSAIAIQAFLRDYHRDENLELVKIVDCCNQASGFEIWRFDFIYTPQKK
jgi:hypothetical protein